MSEEIKKSPEEAKAETPKKKKVDPGPFPCWRYHRTQEARIFHSSAELEAAGVGWRNTPYVEGE